MVEPRPATAARRTELEELLANLRSELRRRDESPDGGWVDQAVADLASGAKPGFYVPAAEGGGLVFFARRGAMAFAHLHAETGAGSVERGEALAGALFAAVPPEVASVDLGFSGLSEAEERTLVSRLAHRPGSTVIDRQALERPLGPEGEAPAPEAPHGVQRLGVREVTLEALADLDRRAFEGTADALLVGRETEDYRRSVGAILDDQLGRFLDEASCALVAYEPTRLVGAILTAEKSARHGVFLDLVVDPERRHEGFGRFLLGWGLRALRALGYERARLWVSDANAPARALYASFGFAPIARATIYRWDRASSSAQPQRSR